MNADGLSTTFSSTRGGVMTVEVGAVTGELELRTTPDPSSGYRVEVRYAGADEWYAVEGGAPLPTDLAHEACHAEVLRKLTTPGERRGFNEDPVSLKGGL
ncbi:Hypothetical Protein RradSPS_1367 [Rubrobacter radiotolerans]|uniref:Uncharacterized protein n=1 Tax=Rubrobacter radiotolerans TaxID=42256 RepID=A0A023X3S8_RUBRA|nr:hypothetical protein [Rubrobacter radiotolerans]AHY46650.1 Hypothetical Protein RradSPS_1367 [Rubrobacter radiotolerans]MDX5894057.1 hypothetical protein [Rubrobacter radiotolerans]SMC05081.1 hypothetical protein SAMN00767673_1366 [Rubrobacter radiotolerans DSM 5868]